MGKTREIVLDTETTGLDADSGDRIIEIGCVELVDFVVTGSVFHKYIDPDRDISVAATKIHGITRDMVVGMPKFADIADEFLDFIKDSTLIIHNARFDLRFLEVEVGLLKNGRSVTNPVVDTLEMARRKFPGTPASLDALCKRFNIPTHDRKLHGALKDATLLAKVYVELREALQRCLAFSNKKEESNFLMIGKKMEVSHYPTRVFTPTDEEKAAHNEAIKKIKNPIWNMYLKEKEANL